MTKLKTDSKVSMKDLISEEENRGVPSFYV